jgi:hypothetical protein
MFACDVELPSASQIESTTAGIAAMYSTSSARAKSFPFPTLAFYNLLGLTMVATLS